LYKSSTLLAFFVSEAYKRAFLLYCPSYIVRLSHVRGVLMISMLRRE
jgi:hypothetical protein